MQAAACRLCPGPPAQAASCRAQAPLGTAASLRPRPTALRYSVSPDAGQGAYLRVLAFEDTEPVAELLDSGGVDVGLLELRHYKDTLDAVERVKRFRPDVLLLDFNIPPCNGRATLRAILSAVAAGVLPRPRSVVGMSSMPSCNEQLLMEGADAAFLKWDVARFRGFDGVRKPR